VIAPLIGLAFGLLWFLVGAGTVAGTAGAILTGAGVVVFAIAAFRAVRRGRPAGAVFRRNYYIAAVVAEVIAIVAAQGWLAAHGRSDLIFPVVGVIVGLHFIGLWKAMGLRRFLALAAAMVAINLIALQPGLNHGQRLTISGFGSSAALLLSAAA
jgi:hypothetical protein